MSAASILRRDEAIALLRSHLDDLRAHSVRSLSLFGSVARDEAGPTSDVDVLVEFEGEPTFRGYMATVAFLEELFARPVDVVTPGSLKPRARAMVERDLIRVA